jgi:excisionase family DNA binding protein
MVINPDMQEQLLKILIEIDQLKSLLINKEKPFLTIEEASKYIGLSKSTIYGYTSKGVIPYYKLQDRKLYFKQTDSDDFILNDKNKHKSNQEIESEAATYMVNKKYK